jgi:hypothetical protein
MNPNMLVDLLAEIDRAGCRTVGINSCCISQDAVPGNESIQLVALESLSLHLSLSTSEWTLLLNRLAIPNLRTLDVEGDVSFSSLFEFHQRHPRIQEMNLKSSLRNPLLPPGTFRRLTDITYQPCDVDSKATTYRNSRED